jgi:hypothetical protein
MIRKAMWLAVPTVLGALVAGWPDIIRFAKIRQISQGSGHPEAVPADGRISYPQIQRHRHADGTGDFDSARRGGPARLAARPG